jgi:hypothetical protein
MINENKDLVIALAIKRLRTTMIGSISKFENVFGYLWGHYKGPDEQLTDQEIYFDNMWQDVRNNVLNHGNKQIRALEEDLDALLRDKPKVTYSYNFKVKEENDNGN